MKNRVTRKRPGFYVYHIHGTTFFLVKMDRWDTGEKTHWNICIEGGEFFDAAPTYADIKEMAEREGLRLKAAKGEG